MKNENEMIIEFLIKILDWGERMGASFLVGGLVGGIIQRMRKRMSFLKFVSSLVIAMFVGWVIGSLLTNWFDLPDRVIYSACAISGVFSEDFLNEIEKLVKNFNEFVKKYVNGKIQ